MGSRQFCRGRGRGRGREVETEARQGRGRGRQLEAEARQTKFEARPRRGDPLKNPPSPRCIAVPNLVALSQPVWQRVNGLVSPPSWVEVIYVIPNSLDNLVILGQTVRALSRRFALKIWFIACRLSRSLKVVGTDTDRSATYNFILTLSFLYMGFQFTGFKPELELRGRTLPLSWPITTELRQDQGRNYEAQPRPRQ